MAQSKKTFVSCIKVKGIHLLPPVITEKKRIELQQYKQQAIKLEKRLKNCRELKKNLEELLNFQPLTDRPPSEITFRDDSHIKALGITEKSRDVGLSSKNKVLRKINLSKDIIDVTEYNSDGIKIIQNDSDTNCDELSQGQKLSNQNNVDASVNETSNGLLFQPTTFEGYSIIEQSDLKCPASQSKTNDAALNSTLKDISPEKSPRPRLIRSNSYTLDSPSPILLAHLQKTSKKGEQKNSEQYQQLSQSRNWSSLENNYIPFENSEFSSINTVYNNDEGFINKRNITNSTPSDKLDSINCENQVSPTIEVIQTDISVQQITVNTTDKFVNEKDKRHLHEESTLNNICDISSPNSQLNQILRNIPENYSKQIIELIQNQKVGPRNKLNSPKKNVKQCVADGFRKDITSTTQNCDNQMGDNSHQNAKENLCSISSKSNFSNGNIHTSSERELDICMLQSASFSDSTTSVSPSQSIHYSITSSDTFQTPSSPVKLIDLEYDYDKSINEKCGLEESKDILELYIQEEIKKINVSRELFPQINATSIQTIKQEWAASVIGAHVKGYLTRRLLKTERVQTLIDTIKDALICALQLHNAENIDESDVELHRRLINQVSAACYAFHDIFFSLSIQEQMSIISTDRQRRIEKARRPASAPGSHRSKSTSSRSSSKQRLHSQSQSLTKV